MASTYIEMESPSRFAVDQVWKGSYMQEKEDDRVFAGSKCTG